MSLKSLRETRAAKVAQMQNIQTTKGENLDKTDLATIKSLGDEVADIDMQIEAIELTRTAAIQNVKPLDEKIVDQVKEIKTKFNNYLRGKITQREFENAVGAGDIGKGKETVPEDFLRELQEKIKEFGVIGNDARHITTSDNGQLHIPTIDDTASAGVWTAEHGSITPADFATGEITMDAWKVTTAITVSTELLEDAFFNVESYLAGALGTRLSRTMEASYINGDGSSKPKGIVTDTSTKDVASKTTAVIEAADALALIAAIQPTSRNGAKFYASDSAIMAMTAWIDSTGRPLLQAQAASTQADGVMYSLYGYPVMPNYELGDVATPGDVPLIFGNANNYMIRDVRNINVRRSDDVRILNDEVVFVATARVDGKIVNANDSFAKLTIIA